MSQIIAGPGMTLPPPQQLFPRYLSNLPAYVAATNAVTLAAGQSQVVPAGEWLINLGRYSLLQWFDPITTTWRTFDAARGNPRYVRSDGINIRVANLTGCPIAAVVTNGGSSYVQSSTTVTVSAGNSTWQPVVGGSITTISVSSVGVGYGMAPLVYIAAPPSPGVQATALATISSGTITSISLTNVGAGYTSVPSIAIVPNPYDPNLASGSITTAATAVVTSIGGNAGKVVAVLCTNSGIAISALPTLTIAGAGSSAAATPVWMNTITGTSVSTAGTGYTGSNLATTVGGRTAATAAFTNPIVEPVNYIPRPYRASVSLNSGALDSFPIVEDTGLFTGTPTFTVLVAKTCTTLGTVDLTLGGATDTIELQQL